MRACVRACVRVPARICIGAYPQHRVRGERASEFNRAGINPGRRSDDGAPANGKKQETRYARSDSIVAEAYDSAETLRLIRASDRPRHWKRA